MVDFAGYSMPVQYPTGIMAEHRHTRAAAGLFDVAHMGQITLSGAGAPNALERLVPVDIVDLPVGQQRYALLTNARGGILDDLMVTNRGDDLLLVVNAACKHTDLAHITDAIGNDVNVQYHDDRALLALQGPAAVTTLARLAPDCEQLDFMQASALQIAGVDCYVSRSGYTGEDGFEIGMANDDCETVARALLEQAEVEPIGLGARDSLRLEAGLCLYGHDITDETTPVEASLLWALSRSRRADGARPGGYPGADIIMQHIAEGTARKRVGLQPEGRAPVREGAVLLDSEGGREIGSVTSGGFGPGVNRPIAMGYVETAFRDIGTSVVAMVRGKPHPVSVAKLPFSPHNYRR